MKGWDKARVQNWVQFARSSIGILIQVIYSDIRMINPVLTTWGRGILCIWAYNYLFVNCVIFGTTSILVINGKKNCAD